MRAALTLAARGLGRVAPNPAVGCVLVRAGHVVGRGWTQPGGRPHAEREALYRAGVAARGATAYVTLEPCSHHGATPPCADALVEAGIARVVAAMVDPDTRVAGRGIARLRAAGIAVETGLLEREARRLNLGFILNRTAGRPLVTLKLATTLDGRIATAVGESQWITGPAAREAAHQIRADHDAIAVGIGTALSDDPSLTVRLPGDPGPAPLRVVFDSRGRLGADAKLADGAVPSLVLVGEGVGAPTGIGGASVAPVARGGDGRIDPVAALTLLAERGVTRLMVEGGGTLAAGLLSAGLVDRIAWFRAGGVIGGDGLAAVGPMGLAALSDMRRFTLAETRPVGADVMELWERPIALDAVAAV
ncbi:bifunctional diaminohydroxyphosphoribosylaminopyrimidine deaminase/5-amino-6-(5-phosphoribosylamino)uracil reductase RibD [Marivibrio halodurans]|uniref:Riboflavin biosynthesis protein RibD n=2 Tax=Marivibrio halodurans TaxID=2039722 RepID=A0A8J7S1B4_9PROT|nr:bifunctional diaminohydroxyphosphoribosylaminopyrimidine deaminase/5-amino-6-(5-phosphoribosylamino)uracil reductase RibD [Marivibrio halodurans]